MVRGAGSRDVEEFFFSQTVVLEDVFLQFLHDFLEGTHLQLVAHDVYDVASCHDAELRIKRLEHLHIDVVHAIKQQGIDVLDKDMFFYHSPVF